MVSSAEPWPLESLKLLLSNSLYIWLQRLKLDTQIHNMWQTLTTIALFNIVRAVNTIVGVFVHWTSTSVVKNTQLSSWVTHFNSSKSKYYYMISYLHHWTSRWVDLAIYILYPWMKTQSEVWIVSTPSESKVGFSIASWELNKCLNPGALRFRLEI